MTERSKNKQLGINLISSFVAFGANIIINFFLSPFVIKRLGISAMGFLGLSSNIIGYTSLITLALNAMAGRFIAIKYQEGKKDEANKYFSSVFFSNLVLSAVVIIILIVFLFNLERFFKIPPHLVFDVKALFAFSILSTIVGLLTNVYGVATFIKNRLELTSIRGIIGNILRACSLVILFGFFPPHLWYYGITGMLMTLYFSFTNYGFTRKLTPEFHLSIKNYDWAKVKELLSAGVWSLVNKLSGIIGHGFDLVIANIFINATAMGLFTMSKSIPMHILGIFGMISGVFSPLFTLLWAQKKNDELKSEIHKAIRICGFLANIPLVCLFVFGDSFYKIWLPGQDYKTIQLLTIIGAMNSVISMPLEPLWNIFTITNKLKVSSLTMFGINILIFLTLMLSMLFVDSLYARLIILVAASTFWNNVKNIFFLPMYGAYCLGYKKTAFYRPLIKSVSCFLLEISLCFPLRYIMTIDSWPKLIFIACLAAIICIAINYNISLEKNDRAFIKQRVVIMKNKIPWL